MKGDSQPSPRRPFGVVFALALAFSVFLADQGLKRLVESSMSVGDSIPVISDILHLTHVKNDGGAFGILGGYGTVLLVGSAAAIMFVLWILLEGPPNRTRILGCGLILGGAIGNLLDRLTVGEVTDYVDLRVWPVFNAADVAIVLGVAVLLLAALRPGAEQRSATGDRGKAQT